MLSNKLQVEVAKAAQRHFQLKPEEVELSATRDLAHGDYTTNVAMKVASRWGVPPREAAETILAELKQSKFIAANIAHFEAAGPGFINFFLKPEKLWEGLATLTEPKSHAVYHGQRVLVEYSSPNIAKPMHIGHLRPTIIGAALANIFESLGAKVTRMNHLGDWGTQFGKLIAAYRRWGNRAAVHRNPIDELLKLYVRFHEVLKEQPELEREGQEEFRKLEAGDRANRALWKWFRAESLRDFNVHYRRLGISFSHIIGEGFYETMLPGLVRDLLKRKLATKNADGSVVVHLARENLPPALVQKSDGASLYLTRDLAAIRYRLGRFKPNRMFYVVGNEQALHFEQLFAVAALAGYSGTAELRHVKFGLILGEDGQKLATREGKIIRLEDVLDEAELRAHAVVEKKNPKLPPAVRKRVTRVVGVDAVKYNDLSQNRHTDIVFSWEKMLSLDGNSAPYLLYSYVRLCSILKKAGKPARKRLTAAVVARAGEPELALLRQLSRYPDAPGPAAHGLGPPLLAGFLYGLATAVNGFYQAVPVLKAEANPKELRLALVRTAADVMQQGLETLGLEVVEQM